MSGDCISNSQKSNEKGKRSKTVKIITLSLINETKLDASFPSNQFAMSGLVINL